MKKAHTDNQISAETKNSPPVKPHNKDVRPREHLLRNELLALLAAAHTGRYAARNYALVLITYRHALRASEAADLKWDNINLKTGEILIVRSKGGDSTTHYLERDEIQALKKLGDPVGFVFKSSRQPCLSERAIHGIVADLGKAAKIKFPIHPHMLRHAKGYQLAAAGTDTRAIQGYMGHRSINSTVIYTQLAPGRFKGFGKGDL